MKNKSDSRSKIHLHWTHFPHFSTFSTCSMLGAKEKRKRFGRKKAFVISVGWYADRGYWILAGSDKPKNMRGVWGSLLINENGVKQVWFNVNRGGIAAIIYLLELYAYIFKEFPHCSGWWVRLMEMFSVKKLLLDGNLINDLEIFVYMSLLSGKWFGFIL